MFATETQLFVGATAEEAKQYVKAWGDLGLDVETFTSDSKKLVLVVGKGSINAVSEATEFIPSNDKPKKGGTT